jgi:hypothetical protein
VTDKIKVNLDYLTYSTIISDVEIFKFYSFGKPNVNKFLNTLISNFYDTSREIDPNLLMIENQDILKTKHDKYIYFFSIRPSKKLDFIFDTIAEKLVKKNVSEYYRKLIEYYCSLNQAQKERIIFKEQYEVIRKSIKYNKVMTFSQLGTKKTCFPLKLVVTQDKLFNYLIFLQDNKLRSFHLYSIEDPFMSIDEYALEPSTLEQVNQLILTSGTYLPSDCVSAKVYLTDTGKMLFRKYIDNRPIATLVDGSYYYFESPMEQLYSYFTRFLSDAIIVFPVELKNRIKNNLLKNLNIYSNINNILDPNK